MDSPGCVDLHPYGDIWSQQGDKLFGSGSVDLDNKEPQLPSRPMATLPLSAHRRITGRRGSMDLHSHGRSESARRGNWLAPAPSKRHFQVFRVALSADGKHGDRRGPDDNTFVGAAWSIPQWRRRESTGDQTGRFREGGSLKPRNASHFAADGNTAIVEEMLTLNVGRLWVYTPAVVSWSQQARNCRHRRGGTAMSGISVGLSGTVTRHCGWWCDTRYAGSMGLHTYGHVWSQQGPNWSVRGRRHSQAKVRRRTFGRRQYAIVAGHEDNGATGALWVYTRSGGVWSQEGTKLVRTARWNGRPRLLVALSGRRQYGLAGGGATMDYTGRCGSMPAQAPGPVPAAQ